MTDERLDAVLSDLASESAWLDEVVRELDESGWRAPTPADGWDVATSIAHLAWTDEAAVLAATDKAGWDALVGRALEDPTGLVDAEAAHGAAAPPAELLTRWRTARQRLAQVLRSQPSGEKLPWFGPPMSAISMATARYMETWAHGLDVAQALGVRVRPHDRVRHVVHLGVRTRGFAFANNGLEVPPGDVRVELVAPSGTVWDYGPADAEQQVTGPAWDFALLVTRRRHRDDLALVALGADADRWLDIAQAFAGPPGKTPVPSGAGRSAKRGHGPVCTSDALT
jgi:uncharacterized protein (TIGR03084 family)